MRNLFCALVAAAMLFLVLSADADTQPQTNKAPAKTTTAKKAAVVRTKQTATPAGHVAPSKAGTSKSPAGKAVATKAPTSKTAPSKAGITKAPASTAGTTKAATSKTAGKTGVRTTVAARNARKVGSKRAPAPTWRNRQVAPTPDRYKEIQQALAAKGYLKPEDATGAWDQNSTDALKRFQADQKLETTGKINALSLIALGLGPKHTVAAASSNIAPNPAEAK